MAEAKQVTRWFTFDGRDFASEVEADAHERDNYTAALSGLTADQVRAAVERKPGTQHIGDAIERAAYLVANARREAGEYRRARNGAGGAPQPAQEADTQPSGGSTVVSFRTDEGSA